MLPFYLADMNKYYRQNKRCTWCFESLCCSTPDAACTITRSCPDATTSCSPSGLKHAAQLPGFVTSSVTCNGMHIFEIQHWISVAFLLASFCLSIQSCSGRWSCLPFINRLTINHAEFYHNDSASYIDQLLTSFFDHTTSVSIFCRNRNR